MNGDLVAFIGAGVGRSAGLPDWNQLLEALAAQTKWDHDMRGAILRLPPEDAAEALKKELRDGLQDLIVAAVSAERYGLSHSLLASMRMREVVTTNYDDLFERACARPHDGNLKVLPRQRVTGRQPWLLKLHGDAAVPESIVLTRSQYLDFDARSAPLAAVVQANMVTRHMLFVGYSLSDNNFIRLAHQVQDLFGQYGDANELLGTVITLAHAQQPVSCGRTTCSTLRSPRWTRRRAVDRLRSCSTASAGQPATRHRTSSTTSTANYSVTRTGDWQSP